MPRAGASHLAVLLALALACLGTGAPARAQDVTVFAAASLKTALDGIAADWSRITGKRVAVSYAASSALARQIEAGAPADLFASADEEWMDWLSARNLIRPDTRTALLGNALVLVAPAAAGVASVRIDRGLDLPVLLGGGRLAVGDPRGVPAGKYAKAALDSLGLWAAAEPRLAPAENVRAALALVARGEVPLGIVYRTDAAAEPGVRVVGTFPEGSHPPIVYPFALTASARAGDPSAFLAHLRSPAAAAAFARGGFTVLPVPAAAGGRTG